MRAIMMVWVLTVGVAYGQRAGAILGVPMAVDPSTISEEERQAALDTVPEGSLSGVPITRVTEPSGGAREGDLVITGRAVRGMKIQATANYSGAQLLPETVELLLLFGAPKHLGIAWMEEVQGSVDWNTGTYRLVIHRRSRTLRPKSLEQVWITAFIPGRGYHYLNIFKRASRNAGANLKPIDEVGRLQVRTGDTRRFLIVGKDGQVEDSTYPRDLSFDGARPGHHTIDIELAP